MNEQDRPKPDSAIALAYLFSPALLQLVQATTFEQLLHIAKTPSEDESKRYQQVEEILGRVYHSWNIKYQQLLKAWRLDSQNWHVTTLDDQLVKANYRANEKEIILNPIPKQVRTDGHEFRIDPSLGEYLDCRTKKFAGSLNIWSQSQDDFFTKTRRFKDVVIFKLKVDTYHLTTAAMRPSSNFANKIKIEGYSRTTQAGLTEDYWGPHFSLTVTNMNATPELPAPKLPF